MSCFKDHFDWPTEVVIWNRVPGYVPWTIYPGPWLRRFKEARKEHSL